MPIGQRVCMYASAIPPRRGGIEVSTRGDVRPELMSAKHLLRSTLSAHSNLRVSRFGLFREGARLIGRKSLPGLPFSPVRKMHMRKAQSSILVDPFSSLHQKCVAWILSAWSSLHAPPIPFGFLWSGTTSL